MAGAVGLAAVATTVPANAAGSGVVYVVQGLPGTVADIAIDGKTVASGAKAAAVVGPFNVSSGQRKLTVRAAGKVLLERNITVQQGGSQDVVVHRPASPSGTPVVTTFKNDLSAVPAGKASVTVAHTAAVAPADIKVNGKVLFANVANGESLTLVVPAGTYSVQIVPAGAAGPSILGPADLPVKGGSLNRVFAIGEPKSGTMNVAVHVLAVAKAGSDKPGKVNTGTGGQAAAASASGSGGPLAAALLVVLSAVAVIRRWAVVRR